MYKSYIKSPLGLLEISCSDNYLERIFVVPKQDFDAQENTISKSIAIQLLEYFDRKRTCFEIPLPLSNDFKSRVYAALFKVPFGSTISYKELAERINSKAYRAVGSAMATNPFFIVVPCHRVVKSDGGLGQFFYGTDMKREMIQFERDCL